MDPDAQSEEKRVLLAAPTARDGEITRSLLAKAGLKCVVCQNLNHLVKELNVGAGAVLLTEEAITAEGINELLTMMENQPSWSDLPVVMMMRQGDQSPVATGVLRSLRNVTLLERPAPTLSVVSAVQAAVRGRERQYQMRDQFESIRKGEMRSRELQEQLEIAVDASELGTFHCDMPLDKIVWNARCKAHFWLLQDAEIDFHLFYSILHPDDRERTREAIAACVYGGKLYDIEYRTVSPRGEVRWVRATGRTYYKEEKPVRFDGTTQDITDRKRVDEERKQLFDIERAARVEAERTSRMKDEFLATLSHELRTPLNAILGWTQLLKRDQQDPEMVSEAISVIERNARAQTQLIEDLLDMSRIISGNVRLDVQGVELSEIINAAMEGVKPAAERKGVRLEKVIDRLVGPFSCDPGRLQQVLWNLLTNAIKFTPKGGKVRVLAEIIQSHVEISVADTGEGISPDFLPHLFERFSQADGSAKRKHRGLGLGLSIVKNLIEMHGGTVQANSRGEGQGATFIIHLPLHTPESSEVEKNPSHPRMSLSGLSVGCERPNLLGIKVLVVEDEADASEFIRRCLVECEALPAVAASAAEAQKLLLTFKPDVIVSDIGMPQKDGYEFIRDVRKQGLTTPAVALSAYARAEDRIRSAQTGYQTHLAKPVEPAELLAVIASLAGRFQRRAEH
jgi:signal transduction histidine kinase/FixJ family two-component response regulator